MPAALRDRVVLLGQVSEEDKVRVLHSVDVYCSPNTGGESFGIVTAEAMAAGVPIVASDIDAFRQVLRGGEAGELFTTGDAAALARAAGRLLDDPARRAALSAAALAAVADYDWSVVARYVLWVYETVVLGSTQVAVTASGDGSTVSRDHRHRHPGRGCALFIGVYVSWRRAGSTGCTCGWTWPAPRWTRPCCAAARWPWSWPPPGCSTRPRA